jgi:mono/diheme cytochrome c family protein
MVIRPIRYIVMTGVLILSLLGLVAAQPAQNKKTAHLTASNPVSGAQLYKRYCAVCHGNDLKGNGPVSPEFKNPPSDLTTLAQRHEGKFPDSYIQNVLQNGVKTPAHGDTEMPIWGPLFASIPGTDPELVKIRIVNLTLYIKSMQAK